ncbi:hypothetical protein ACHQM5_013317 [Ranunculus cassubicifolius]
MLKLRLTARVHTIFPPKSLFLNYSTKIHHKFPQPDQQNLLSLLLKHPTRTLAIQIHSHLITTGFPHLNSTNKSSTLIFNTLLRVYSQDHFPNEALNLYKHTTPSFPFNSFILSFLMKACTDLNQFCNGVQVHGVVVKVGFEFHVYVGTTLVSLYCGCGILGDAMKVFDEMPERNLVSWNSMVTGLTKWGKLDIAMEYFDRMPERNVVSWTVMIDGYTRGDRFMEALRLFCQMMVVDGLKPTDLTILAVLPAVYNVRDLNWCRLIHAYGEKTGFNASDIRVMNSLLDAYSKCGSIENAFRLFREIPAKRRNLVTWTSMISSFAMHGMALEALEQFKQMEKEALKPNQITFLSVLSACSHGGLVKEGVGFFKKMVDEYKILPNIKHYGCMIDMLGRAGMLEEAEKIAMDIPLEIVNVVVWRTLLGACSFHGNVEMGERVMRKIVEIEKGYAGDYVLLSNIFSGVGRFGDAATVRTLMDERNAMKAPGRSLVDDRG